MSEKQENMQAIQAIQLRKQYLRDCSFENPNAPQCFAQQVQPKINIALNLKSTDMGPRQSELNMFIEASAKTDDQNIFLASIQYCGVFELPEGVDAERKQEMMLVNAAATLFPYARQVIAKLTLEGGFPPLDLGHVDFAALYQQKKQSNEISEFASEDDAKNHNANNSAEEQNENADQQSEKRMVH